MAFLCYNIAMNTSNMRRYSALTHEASSHTGHPHEALIYTTLPLAWWTAGAILHGIRASAIIEGSLRLGGMDRLAQSLGLQRTLIDSKGQVYELPDANIPDTTWIGLKSYVSGPTNAILQHAGVKLTNPDDKAELAQVFYQGAHILNAAARIEDTVSLQVSQEQSYLPTAAMQIGLVATELSGIHLAAHLREWDLTQDMQ
jgi:hypothetical protein